MRILEFEIDKQVLKKKNDCDFTGIIHGTRKYLNAKFNFSKEWIDCTKVVSFWNDNKEYAVVLENDICVIPHEVLSDRRFGISIIGVREDGYRITTTKISILQEG